jgi:RNA polymerase sigma-70 factor (ECF subfamily)
MLRFPQAATLSYRGCRATEAGKVSPHVRKEKHTVDPNSVVRLLIADRARLLGYVWAIVHDPHLADDVFQDVTVLAIERAAEIADEAHLKRWARKAARFKAFEGLRKRSPHLVPLDEDVMELLEAEWDVRDSTATAEQAEHLRACMDRLSPHARTVLKLRYAEGLSGARVAEALQIKVQSVYVALARVHRLLGDCIRQRRIEAGQHA